MPVQLGSGLGLVLYWILLERIYCGVKSKIFASWFLSFLSHIDKLSPFNNTYPCFLPAFYFSSLINLECILIWGINLTPPPAPNLYLLSQILLIVRPFPYWFEWYRYAQHAGFTPYRPWALSWAITACRRFPALATQHWGEPVLPCQCSTPPCLLSLPATLAMMVSSSKSPACFLSTWNLRRAVSTEGFTAWGHSATCLSPSI